MSTSRRTALAFSHARTEVSICFLYRAIEYVPRYRASRYSLCSIISTSSAMLTLVARIISLLNPEFPAKIGCATIYEHGVLLSGNSEGGIPSRLGGRRQHP